MADHHSNALGQPIGAPLGDWQPPAWPAHEALCGAWAQLEPLSADRHAAALFAAYAEDVDGRNWTYLPYGPFSDVDAFSAWVRANTRAPDPQFYAVRERRTERVLGVASFLRIAPEAGTIEVGHIHFAPAAQRTPVSTDAMYLMMAHVFAAGFRRYEWKCDALNQASCAAAARLGFRFEGTWRQATHYKSRNRDTAWFAVVDRDWPALDAAYRRWLHPDNFDAEGRQRQALSALTAISPPEAETTP
ncbi:MAG: GNAT family protein [Pseudomonadota bacterium]